MPAKQLNKPSTEEYGKFLESLRLISVALKKCSARLDRQAHWQANRKGKTPAKHLAEKYGVSAIGENYFDLEGTFEVLISDADAKTEALSLQCTFEVHIHSDPPIQKSFVERFAQAELRLLLLPYARHFVTNITGQMDIRPVVIPLAIGQDQKDHKELRRVKPTDP